jgi:hypothetical protein
LSEATACFAFARSALHSPIVELMKTPILSVGKKTGVGTLDMEQTTLRQSVLQPGQIGRRESQVKAAQQSACVQSYLRNDLIKRRRVKCVVIAVQVLESVYKRRRNLLTQVVSERGVLIMDRAARELPT